MSRRPKRRFYNEDPLIGLDHSTGLGILRQLPLNRAVLKIIFYLIISDSD